MRWIALLLLFANAAWLAWTLLVGRPSIEGASAPAPLPADAPGIVLLSEVPPAPGDPPAPPPEPAAPPEVRSCHRLGPLGDVTAADQVVERLQSLGLPTELQSREVPAGTPDYQVYLPPLPSLEQARRQVRELQALGVEAYVMGRDELAGAVSVGLFTEDERAEARRAEVARLGYDVRTRVIERTRRIFEVRVGVPEAGMLTALLADLHKDWPALGQAPAACP